MQEQDAANSVSLPSCSIAKKVQEQDDTNSAPLQPSSTVQESDDEAKEVGAVSLPQKKYYRQRAHTNPMADHCFDYPASPDEMDWSKYFSKELTGSQSVEFLDIGCGYGGLLLTLGEMYHNTLILGLEIRVKVADYVMDRIKALRAQNEGQYQNIACLRTNAMKYLPNYFKKGQLKKMFFLYPDPHFKKSKHKWRIINKTLLDEYAYVLSNEARVYTVTDVKDLYEWIVQHFTEHPLFERLTDFEMCDDPCTARLPECTEEGQKVTRNNGDKFVAVFRRVSDPYFATQSHDKNGA